MYSSTSVDSKFCEASRTQVSSSDELATRGRVPICGSLLISFLLCRLFFVRDLQYVRDEPPARILAHVSSSRSNRCCSSPGAEACRAESPYGQRKSYPKIDLHSQSMKVQSTHTHQLPT